MIRHHSSGHGKILKAYLYDNVRPLKTLNATGISERSSLVLIPYTTCSACGILSLCRCIQHPERRKIDLPFTIPRESESLPGSIQICPSVRLFCLVAVECNFRDMLLIFSALTCFGPRTKAIKNWTTSSTLYFLTLYFEKTLYE